MTRIHPCFLLASFLLLPQEGLPLLLVGWTLVYEMLFYAGLAATLLVRRSWLWWVLGVWVAVIIGLAPLEQATSNVWVGLVLSPRNLEFVLGVGLAAVVLAGRLVAPSLLCLVGLALLAVAVVIAPDGGPAEGWLRWRRSGCR